MTNKALLLVVTILLVGLVSLFLTNQDDQSAERAELKVDPVPTVTSQ